MDKVHKPSDSECQNPLDSNDLGSVCRSYNSDIYFRISINKTKKTLWLESAS
jgi:hypothetical protein